MEWNETTSLPVTDISRKWIIFYFLVIVVQCLESLLIIGGNILTLVVLKRTKKLHDIPTHVFTASLALSDGFVGILIPFRLAMQTSEDVRYWQLSECIIRGLYYAVIPITLFTLSAIAVDRYIAVVHPLTYRRRMTRRIAIVLSTLIWIVMFVVAMWFVCYVEQVPGHLEVAKDLLPEKLFVILIQMVILTPIALTILLYLGIYINLRKRASIGSVICSDRHESVENQSSKRAKAITRMMALVVGYLLISWLPYYILISTYTLKESTTPDWYWYAFQISTCLFYSNSFVNPVIYSWKNRNFKDAYMRLLTCPGSVVVTRISDNNPMSDLHNRSTTY